MRILQALLTALCFSSLLRAESVKDREGAVRGDRAKMEHDDRWIYDNYQRGFDEAKRTGKPLLVTHAGQYGMHAAAKKAGFQKDDLIIAIDGLTQRMGEGPVLDHLLQKKFPGCQVSVTILRNQERRELILPMQ
jgi:hypothetical protein